MLIFHICFVEGKGGAGEEESFHIKIKIGAARDDPVARDEEHWQEDKEAHSLQEYAHLIAPQEVCVPFSLFLFFCLLFGKVCGCVV